MKKWYVYEILNQNDEVEYVGETIDPERRWGQHTTRLKSKFYLRKYDCRMNIVAEFTNRKAALELEGKLKQQYGLKWEEKERAVQWRMKGSKAAAKSEKHLKQITELGKSGIGKKAFLKKLKEGTVPQSYFDAMSRNGKINGAKNVESGHIQELGKKYGRKAQQASQYSWKCEHCSKEGVGASNYSRWHGENCKKRPKHE